MPSYRIISELDLSCPHRRPRGESSDLDEARVITVVEADSLAEASNGARDTEPHRERRITSVEELHPGFTYSDGVITQSIGTTHGNPSGEEPLVDPQAFWDTDGNDQPLYETVCFAAVVEEVAYGLRESGLVPGLDLSMLANDPDEPYAMVEVHDYARMVYVARGCEVRKLTDDRQAAGWGGVLAIARQLIAISNELQ